MALLTLWVFPFPAKRVEVPGGLATEADEITTEHVGILNASFGRLWRIMLHPHAAWGAWKTPLTRQHNTENLTFVKLFLIF